MPPAQFSPYPYAPPYAYVLQQPPQPQPHLPTRQLPVTKAAGAIKESTKSTNKRKAPPAAAAASKKPAAGVMPNQKRPKPTSSSSAKTRKAPPTNASKKSPPSTAVATTRKVKLWATKAALKPVPTATAALKPAPTEQITWETRYEQLEHFQKGHGHCRVPVRYNKTPGLGTWVSRTRSMYKDIVLRRHQQQREQQQEGGGGDTPDTAATNKNEAQSTDKNDSTMSTDNLKRFEKLNLLGFHWMLRDPSPPFEERFQDLVAFKQEFGHCRVKRTHPLGEWVHNLRKEYKSKQGRLTVQERVTKLLELGFEFSVASAVPWEQRLEQLMDFRRKYGHVNVFEVHRQAVKENDIGASGTGDDVTNEHEDEDNDNNDTDGKEDAASAGSQLIENGFLRWVETQQRSYWTEWKLGKKSRLNKTRIKQLQDMGFDFGPERQPHAKGAHKGPHHHRTDAATYSTRLEQLRQYKVRHGDCLVPREWPENPQLGSWAASQRKQYRSLLNGKSSSLTKERRVELDSMGFVWVVRPWNLKENRKRKDDPQKDDATTSTSGENSE
jgi:hypothetical protein